MPLNLKIMPFKTDALATIGIVWTGIRFTSAVELIFVLVMALPLLFWTGCVLYLWRLLLYAMLMRRRITVLMRPLLDTQESSEKAIQTGNFTPVLPTSQSKTRFALLIPAHNEELLLGAVLDSLSKLDYPRSHFQLVVIADNCTDRTAEIARAHGAYVMERFDQEQIGKGYALEWALQKLLISSKEGVLSENDRQEKSVNIASIPVTTVPVTTVPVTTVPVSILPASTSTNVVSFDAVVILDADTLASANLLTVFDKALQCGERALQARYDVLNTDESWRTRLMGCALALAHVAKPLGRERLGLSDGLKGNGMCFDREVVERIPWSGASITEDIEYTLRLCRAGYRVTFLPEATVWAQMPTTGAQSTSQRKRWESGRYHLLFTVAPSLVRESIVSRNRLLFDRAIELIIPPFAEMFAFPLVLLMISLGAVALGWPWATKIGILWTLLLLLEAGYLFLGLWVARIPGKVAVSLLYAPFYIIWKFGVYAVMAVGRSTGGWKRTERREL